MTRAATEAHLWAETDGIAHAFRSREAYDCGDPALCGHPGYETRRLRPGDQTPLCTKCCEQYSRDTQRKDGK